MVLHRSEGPGCGVAAGEALRRLAALGFEHDSDWFFGAGDLVNFGEHSGEPLDGFER